MIIASSLQKSAEEDPLYVPVKVHDERKTEAMLLDIWKASGRSGSQGQRALADDIDDRWREKIIIDFLLVFLF